MTHATESFLRIGEIVLDRSVTTKGQFAEIYLSHEICLIANGNKSAQ